MRLFQGLITFRWLNVFWKLEEPIQIRVHMKSIGHPLFNDERYGGNKILKGTTFTKYKQFVENCFKIMPRQALHAKTLGFVHPTTKYLEFDSDLPNDLHLCIEKWKKYSLNSMN